MAGKRLYPRSTVKKIVKAHSNRSVSKNADILVCLHHPPPPQICNLALPITDFVAISGVSRLRTFYGRVKPPRSDSYAKEWLADDGWHWVA